MKDLTPVQCPKYQKCLAPICPLDADWQKRKHISGDRICFYLLEAQKTDAKAIFSVCGLEYLYPAMVSPTQKILQRHHTIKLALDKAKGTKPRLGRKVGSQ